MNYLNQIKKRNKIDINRVIKKDLTVIIAYEDGYYLQFIKILKTRIHLYWKKIYGSINEKEIQNTIKSISSVKTFNKQTILGNNLTFKDIIEKGEVLYYLKDVNEILKNL